MTSSDIHIFHIEQLGSGLTASAPQARSYGETFGGSAPQISYVPPPNFPAPRKICFKNIIKTKILPP